MGCIKKIVLGFTLLIAVTLVAGCGDGEGENETNTPGTKLTASAVTSQTDISVHTHAVIIPFSDFSSAPAADIYQYRSDTVNGHSHVIALTKQQMKDINNGMRVATDSSFPDAGSNHFHAWSIQGGDLLYEKFCYNCHSNDERGQSPMNVSFNTSQTGAVKNPSGAPLSTSLAATPDPNFIAGAVNATPDGVALYASNCAGCHGSLASTTKPNRTAAQIRAAINANAGGMGSLGSLTDAELKAIEAALVK